MIIINKKIREDHKYYNQLCKNRFLLEENKKNRTEVDKLIIEIDDFVENVYALDIFEKYSPKNPVLIDTVSGKQIKWDEAFGSHFLDVSKSLKHSIVGLFEEGGRYKFK